MTNGICLIPSNEPNPVEPYEENPSTNDVHITPEANATNHSEADNRTEPYPAVVNQTNTTTKCNSSLPTSCNNTSSNKTVPTNTSSAAAKTDMTAYSGANNALLAVLGTSTFFPNMKIRKFIVYCLSFIVYDNTKANSNRINNILAGDNAAAKSVFYNRRE